MSLYQPMYSTTARLAPALVGQAQTGTDLDKTWAQQAIDALLALNEAAGAARAAGQDAIDAETRARHEDWYRKAAGTGTALTPPARASSSRNGTPSPRG